MQVFFIIFAETKKNKILMTEIIITIVVIVGCILLFRYTSKLRAKAAEHWGKDALKEVVTSKYVSGHPDINAPAPISVRSKDGDLYLLRMAFSTNPIATIKGDSIVNVVVEDETTFSNKVTLARMALVGVFAFAMKKRKKAELAYLTIKWNDGRFEHETVFEYEGTGSLAKANTDRNRILKWIK